MNRIPQLYSNPIVHKDQSTQVPFRPVNSQVGSLSVLASIFIDYYQKKFIPFIPGYVKKSFQVIEHLKNVNFNLDNLSVLTLDAKAMYPIILSDKGITACKKYSELYTKEYKSYFPSLLIIKLLRLIITCNAFELGNTYWVQNDGTAM